MNDKLMCLYKDDIENYPFKVEVKHFSCKFQQTYKDLKISESSFKLTNDNPWVTV